MIDGKGLFGGATLKESPNTGSSIRPQFIVMHYTASWTGESAIGTLTRSGSKVSAHFVIDRTGEITQLVPCDTAAWHAGPSRWRGYNGLNGYSVGIEFVNIGYLRPIDDEKALDPYGNVRTLRALPMLGNAGFIRASHPRIGHGVLLWPAFTDEQLSSGDALTKALVDRYPIEEILSHEQIDTRGWKTDPGPAFPMDRYRAMLGQGEVEHWRKFRVTAKPSLNVRGGPGTGFERLDGLSPGEVVFVMVEDGDWSLVKYGKANDQKEGWVHAAYIQAVL